MGDSSMIYAFAIDQLGLLVNVLGENIAPSLTALNSTGEQVEPSPLFVQEALADAIDQMNNAAGMSLEEADAWDALIETLEAKVA
jgi:hypothetical protein